MAAGGTVTFSGDGCVFNPAPPFNDPGPLVFVEELPGAEVTIDRDASSGTFTGTIAIPATAEPGQLEVSARCQRSLESGLGFTFGYFPHTLSVGVAPTTSTTTTTTSTVVADPNTSALSTTTTTSCTLEHPCPGPFGIGTPAGGPPVEDLLPTSRTTVGPSPATRPVRTGTARNISRTGMATDRYLTTAGLLLCLGMALVVGGHARHHRGIV
ncbi:MAG: hypothetical protein M3179_07575 [Actinomycetota bacterium]|nr:hypothetical protein [Actinomycetota bacterium]